MIIGGNGSGKTTFSKILCDKLKLPLIHLDVLYWRDNWQTASQEEFDGLLMQELIKPKWIMDGNMSRTIPLRLKYCDTMIYSTQAMLK
jgi:adenylate kinase family enzyme